MLRDPGDGAGKHTGFGAMALALLLPTAAMLFLMSAGSAAGATVSVATPGTAEEGSTFSVNVQVQSVADLYGVQFDLSFNPDVLEALSVSEGSFLKQGASTFWISPAIDNVAGTIEGAAQTRLVVDNGVDGSGTLATVSFRAKATGTSSLSLGNVVLVDSNAHAISFSTQPGSVAVQPPPPPPIPPETRVTGGPIGTIGVTTATFTWTGSDPDGFVASYDYRMDSGAWVTTTETSETFTGLSKGDHTFYVRARDDDGILDPTPDLSPFTVYFTVNPDTQILSGPSGTVEGNTATFEWTGTDADGQVVSYLHRLDNQAWLPTTDARFTYTNLSHGNHTFWVKAVDNEGFEDPTPAERAFSLKPYWWESEMERLNEEIAELEARLQAAQEELEAAQAEVQEAQAELEEERRLLEGQMESLRSTVEALQVEKRDLESRNDGLMAEISDLEGLNGELQANATDLGRRLDASEDANLALSLELDRLKGQLEDKDAQLQQTRDDLDKARGDIVVMEGWMESLGNQTLSLQQQIDELKAGVGELEAGKEALEEWARAAEEDKSALQQEIGQLERKLSTAEHEIAGTMDRMAEKQSELDAMEVEKTAQSLHLNVVEETNRVLVTTRQTLMAALGGMAVLAVVLLGMTTKYRRRVRNLEADRSSSRDFRPPETQGG